MKKILISIPFLIALLSFASIGRAETFQNKCLDLISNLGQGARDNPSNKNVTDLQLFLVEKKYLKVNPTGYFGSQTAKAVKVFQKENSIPQTGYIGPLTRALIKKITCVPTLEQNTTQTEGLQTTNPPTNTPVVIAEPVADEILSGGSNNSSLRVKTTGVISVTNTTASVRGDITAGARSTTEAWFELTTNPTVYKKSETLISQKVLQRSNERFDTIFTGLQSGKMYYFRACAENISLGQKTCGNTVSFITLN